MMWRKLHTYPFHFLLLPVFFVLHGYLENGGILETSDTILLILYYGVAAALLALFYYVILRRLRAAALMTTGTLMIYFFFGAFHDMLDAKSPLPFLQRYLFQLPFLALLLLLLFQYARTHKNQLERSCTYLNIVLLAFLAYEGATAGLQFWGQQPFSPLAVYPSAGERQLKYCDSCAKPDIFLLLYDEYSSPTLLNAQYKAANTLPEFLASRGFRYLSQSRANYNFTPFSMASLLNMAYLNGIRNPQAVTAEDYARCNALIKNNRVIHFLDRQGYAIINFSVFDLAGNPSPVNQHFLPLKTNLITERTLLAYIRRDLGWQLAVQFPFRYFFPYQHQRNRENNLRFHELVKQAAAKQGQPRFIYTHFFMPHPPFFFDRKGRQKEDAVAIQEYRQPTITGYIDYAAYVNTKIEELVLRIQQQNPGAVIVLMSDHGYREAKDRNYPDFFSILNAIYLPDQDYRAYSDSLSAVNQFRVLLNKYYPGSFSLLPDTSVYLKDYKEPPLE